MLARDVPATMAGTLLGVSLFIAAAWSQGVRSASPAPTSTPVETLERYGYHTALDHPFATMGRVTDTVRLSLTPAMVATRIGQPVSVGMWINSANGKPLLLCFLSLYDSLRFVASDSTGTLLQQLTPSISERLNERSSQCFLKPNQQLHYVLPLAEYLRIDKPGDYSVTAVLKAEWKMHQQDTPIQSNSIVLRVTK